MYTINTQLAYFICSFNSQRLILNLKWFRLDKADSSSLKALSFNSLELEQFQAFIGQNPLNFPGQYFVEPTKIEEFDFFINSNVPQGILSFYPVLSKNADTDTHPSIHQVMKIALTDENYQPAAHYKLDFDVIGKIEIYRNAK
ncbi:hypothetical protein [Flavobacterium sp. HJSW_4]|uniref:hypothetical protein n=1 Tax=Flavobacterium sp. HJSW_4 TaxID=3344660 RepID=UPI0035F30EE9